MQVHGKLAFQTEGTANIPEAGAHSVPSEWVRGTLVRNKVRVYLPTCSSSNQLLYLSYCLLHPPLSLDLCSSPYHPCLVPLRLASTTLFTLRCSTDVWQ